MLNAEQDACLIEELETGLDRGRGAGLAVQRPGLGAGAPPAPGDPVPADVAHCRVNLLTFGTEAAERFTALWQDAAYHPWADIVTIIGFLEDLRRDWGSERLLVEDMLAHAVAELGGNTR